MLRRTNPSLHVSAGVALALVSVALAPPARAQPGAGPSPVVAARAVQETVTAAQTFVGSVTPVKRATIGSAVDGRVVEVAFEEGDRVEAGQKLVQLLTETISLEIASAEGELELRQQRLAELENGTLPEEIKQAEARMKVAASQRDFLIARRDRLREVIKTRGAISEDEVQEAEAAAVQAVASYEEAQAAHQLAVDGPRQEVIAQARAQVAIQQAIVERLRDQMRKYTISSKFDGYAVAQHTEEGAWVNTGDPVAEVVAVDQVEIVAQVVEQSVPYIVPGTKVRVEAPALPQRMFEGEVVTTVQQGDARSRTFPVKIRVENELTPAGPLLKPGMYARVALPVGDQQQAILVPKDAIVLGQDKPIVYVVSGATSAGDTGKATPMPVTLGVAKGVLIQVTGGLRAGQLVVVQGNERLRPGEEVSIIRVVDGKLAAAARSQ